MKSMFAAISAGMGLLGGFLGAGTAAAEPSLIPWPVTVEAKSGSFTVHDGSTVCAPGDAAATGQQLKDLVKAMRGLDLKTGCGNGAIRLVLSPTAAVNDAEGYSLDVGASGATLSARNTTGLYYAAVTFSQLVSSDGAFDAPARIAGTHIADYPRFRWRGLMLDSARHFLPPGAVKVMIDQMAQHKLNTLHWHLSDDQGWRIEIKRYPELTKIGAWRTPPSNGGPGSETEPYGGFYTQDDIRGIVAYAAARHITIVPEIDMPGHAQAVVAAHPALSVPGDQPQVSPDWGVNWYLYNTDDDSIAFVKNVLDEVMDLFPGQYIHLGGDEAVKNQWKASPKIQAQMKALGITSEDALQSWFMEQMGQYLAAHGRRMIGWDEILEGGVPPSAAVMSWRGTQGAITASRLGHDVVLSPASILYFDNLQSRRDDEPAGRLGASTLSQVYNFEVMPPVLNAEEQRHVLGAQANLWSEYLLSPWYNEHAAFPRVDALSEMTWSQPSALSWSGFLKRLPAQMQRYRHQKVAAADSAFAVDFQLPDGRNAALDAGGGVLTLVNQTAFGQIRYTLDGSEPTPKSALYTAPLTLTLGAHIKAAAFSDAGLPLAAARAYDFSADTLLSRSSNQLRACPDGDLGLRVPLTADSPAAAPAYDIDIFHMCHVYPQARLTGIASVRVDIARLSRNYGLANDQAKVTQYPARTQFGELVILQDGCQGAEIARLPLTDPATTPNRKTLTAPIPATTGAHDLCLLFTAPIAGPFYAIDTVNLVRK